MQVLIVVGLVLWILVSFTLLVGLLWAAPTLGRLSKLLGHLDRVLDRTERELDPIFEHVRRSADDLDYITSAVRTDVEDVGDTVEEATETTRRLLALAEERALEINGFLAVVQEEAEESFYSTASVLRALRGGRGERERR